MLLAMQLYLYLVSLILEHTSVFYCNFYLHNLLMINIFTHQGDIRAVPECINSNGSDNTEVKPEIPERYKKIERFAARRLIVQDIEALDLLDAVEEKA